MDTMRQKESQKPDEESIEYDSPDGGSGFSCRVSTKTGGGSRVRDTKINAEPGNFIRASVNFQGSRQSEKHKVSARVLAYVNPINGKGTIRIGLYMDGKEFGKQIVYETDVPVWKGNK